MFTCTHTHEHVHTHKYTQIQMAHELKIKKAKALGGKAEAGNMLLLLAVFPLLRPASMQGLRTWRFLGLWRQEEISAPA